MSPTLILADEIRQLVSAARRNLEHLDDEKEKLENELNNHLDRLHTNKIRREAMRRQVDLLSRCLSPIDRIPNEVLLRIFDFTCKMNCLVESHGDINKGQTPAITISSVCVRWRSLALSLPKLWSRISVEFKSIAWDCNSTNLEISTLMYSLNLHLQRSKNHPLTFEIDIANAWYHSTSDSDNPVLNMIGMTANRWQHFRLIDSVTSSRFEDCAAFLFAPEGEQSFPNLVELEAGADWELLDCFTSMSAPNLHSLIWRGKFINKVQFPWLQLTSIVMKLSDGDVDFCELLDTCSALEHITLDDTGGSDWQFKPCTPPRLLSNLKSLTLFSEGSNLVNNILYSLTCPALEILHLTETEKLTQIQHPTYDSLMDFVTRSSFLPSLTLHQITLVSLGLVSFLGQLKSLRDLTIDDGDCSDSAYSPITDLFITSLDRTNIHPNSDSFLPKLHRLVLSCSGKAFEDTKLCDMLISRWTTNGGGFDEDGEISCLREVVVRAVDRAIQPGISKRLRLLEKAGMRITVVSTFVEGLKSSDTSGDEADNTENS